MEKDLLLLKLCAAYRPHSIHWADVGLAVGATPAYCQQRWEELQTVPGLHRPFFSNFKLPQLTSAVVNPTQTTATTSTMPMQPHSPGTSRDGGRARTNSNDNRNKTKLEAHKARLEDMPNSNKQRDGMLAQPTNGRPLSQQQQQQQQQQPQPQKKRTVVIRVCDEEREVNRDFSCDREMLVAEMKYFMSYLDNDVEDIDISVHCDVVIFESLLQFIGSQDRTAWSRDHVDVGNVVGLLISSEFLQMDALVDVCLQFFKQNVNEIVASPVDFTCLSDALMLRLASLYSTDAQKVDLIKDKKDKLISKLYRAICQLLLNKPENVLYQCCHCSQLFTDRQWQWMRCPSAPSFIDFHGEVSSQHAPNPQWNCTAYLTALRVEKHRWRWIYWGVWCLLKDLYCTACQERFVLVNYNQCRCLGHAKPAVFDRVSHQGVYPCCDTVAYRTHEFGPRTVCAFTSHVLTLDKADYGKEEERQHILATCQYALGVLSARMVASSVVSGPLFPLAAMGFDADRKTAAASEREGGGSEGRIRESRRDKALGGGGVGRWVDGSGDTSGGGVTSTHLRSHGEHPGEGNFSRYYSWSQKLDTFNAFRAGQGGPHAQTAGGSGGQSLQGMLGVSGIIGGGHSSAFDLRPTSLLKGGEVDGVVGIDGLKAERDRRWVLEISDEDESAESDDDDDLSPNAKSLKAAPPPRIGSARKGVTTSARKAAGSRPGTSGVRSAARPVSRNGGQSKRSPKNNANMQSGSASNMFSWQQKKTEAPVDEAVLFFAERSHEREKMDKLVKRLALARSVASKQVQ